LLELIQLLDLVHVKLVLLEHIQLLHLDHAKLALQGLIQLLELHHARIALLELTAQQLEQRLLQPVPIVTQEHIQLLDLDHAKLVVLELIQALDQARVRIAVLELTVQQLEPPLLPPVRIALQEPTLLHLVPVHARLVLLEQPVMLDLNLAQVIAVQTPTCLLVAV